MLTLPRSFLVLSGLGLCACSGSSDGAGNPGGSGGAGSGTGGSGGAGVETECRPEALSQTNLGPVGSATSLISDGTYVYYSTTPDPRESAPTRKPDNIVKLSVSGGTPVVLVAGVEGGAGLSDLALDETDVYYFLTDSGLSKVAKAGGTPTTIAQPKTPRVTLEFTADATSIFYHEVLDGLVKVSKNGGDPTLLWATDRIYPRNFASDVDNVYFVGRQVSDFSLDEDAGPRERPAVYRLPKTGGTPTKVVELTSDPSLHEDISMLVADGDNLVYSTTSDRSLSSSPTTVYSVPKNGGAAAKLADEGPALAAAGGTVYYGVSSGLKKVSEAGGAPVEVPGADIGLPDAIALDAESVYWSVQGCIYKALR
jgi:hypothetical protein